MQKQSAKAIQSSHPGLNIGNKSQQIPRHPAYVPGVTPGMAADKWIMAARARSFNFFIHVYTFDVRVPYVFFCTTPHESQHGFEKLRRFLLMEGRLLLLLLLSGRMGGMYSRLKLDYTKKHRCGLNMDSAVAKPENIFLKQTLYVRFFGRFKNNFSCCLGRKISF